jgi:hypothetical protein
VKRHQAPSSCRTCGDPYFRRGAGELGRLPGTPGARFRFCPSCWAAAKIGYRAGFAIAAIAGAVLAGLARWFQL